MILNLTQHNPSSEQIAEGVVNPDALSDVRPLLTIETEILTASPDLRAEALDARVSSIMGCLYRQLSSLRKERMTQALEEETAMAMDNAMSQPICSAMIGGAPYLTERLVPRLRAAGVRPVYAISERVSQEVVQEDGSTKKVAQFRHLGFIETL
jgi:hypothetical protein